MRAEARVAEQAGPVEPVAHAQHVAVDRGRLARAFLEDEHAALGEQRARPRERVAPRARDRDRVVGVAQRFRPAAEVHVHGGTARGHRGVERAIAARTGDRDQRLDRRGGDDGAAAAVERVDAREHGAERIGRGGGRTAREGGEQCHDECEEVQGTAAHEFPEDGERDRKRRAV